MLHYQEIRCYWMSHTLWIHFRYVLKTKKYDFLLNQQMFCFQHGMGVENVHSFANGGAIPPYYLQQQLMNDFVAPMKVDHPWEPSRSMTDLQDKPHVCSLFE